MKKKIAILSGEPNSINSEIIAKSWKKINKKKRERIFLIGNFDLFKSQLKELKIDIPLKKIYSINEINSRYKLNILNVNLKYIDPFKVKDISNSKYVKECLNLAHNLAIKKKIFGFINCSINKRSLGKNNLGVTEYLAKKNKLKNTEVMMIYNDKLSVVPITTHVNIRNISKKLTGQLIKKKIETINKYYIKIFNKKPIIAVLGLNPHNSEFRRNSEEVKIISPVVKKLKKRNFRIIGPLSSDTAFMKAKKSNYNVVVGMYHDQVLTPFKALFGLNAINITLGLKYIRISPDHGTAKDLVKRKKSKPTSLLMAINLILNLK